MEKCREREQEEQKEQREENGERRAEGVNVHIINLDYLGDKSSNLPVVL